MKRGVPIANYTFYALMITSHPANSLPLPPGRSGLPVIGETLNFLQDPDFANKRCQQYGNIFRTHLKQMEYLDRVLKEVLRLVPPVAGGFREVIQSCEINGYTIPKGWSVLYHIGLTHQDPSLYPNPKQFDPERFDPARTGETKPLGYAPFGGGVRECLGKEFARLEMKIFAALLVRDYEWNLVTEQNLDLEMIPSPRPKDGLKVHFRRKATDSIGSTNFIT